MARIMGGPHGCLTRPIGQTEFGRKAHPGDDDLKLPFRIRPGFFRQPIEQAVFCPGAGNNADFTFGSHGIGSPASRCSAG